MTIPIFDHAHPKIIQMQKISSFHLFILEMQSILGSHDQTGIFDQLLVYKNLHQHAKNQAISSISFGDMVDKKNPTI